MKRFAFYTPSGDTLVRFRLELIRSLIKLDYEVHVLISECKEEFYEILVSEGVIIHQTNLKRKSINLFQTFQSILEAKKILREINPTHVFSYLHKGVVVGSIAAKMAGIRNIISLITGTGHVFDNKTFKQKIARFLGLNGFKLGLYFSNKVIFQNPDNLNLFLDLNLVTVGKTSIVNGSGVDMELFGQSPLPDEPIFMCLSRLIYSKGLLEYAQAAKIVKEEFPNSRFLLYGIPDKHYDSIPEEEIINTWQDKFGIEYLGYAHSPQDALKDCSVYVLLSYNEGTPRSVLEALSVGRAIITTDTSGCRETVIDGSNGFLVEVGNHNEAAEAMKKLIDPSLRMKMAYASKELCKIKYDVHLVNAQILKEIGIL